MVDQQTEGGLTLEVMAERLRADCIGLDGERMDRGEARDVMAYILTGFWGGSSRDAALADILARLARPADRPGNAAVPHTASIVGLYTIKALLRGEDVVTEGLTLLPASDITNTRYIVAVAPTPPAPVGLVEAAQAALDTWKACHQSTTGARFVLAMHTLDATLSGQTGGAEPAGDQRPGLIEAKRIIDGVMSDWSIPGVEKGEYIVRCLRHEMEARGIGARLSEQPGGGPVAPGVGEPLWAALDEVRDLFPASDESVGFTPFEDWKLRVWKLARRIDLPSVEAFAEALFYAEEWTDHACRWADLVSETATPTRAIVQHFRNKATRLRARLAEQPGGGPVAPGVGVREAARAVLRAVDDLISDSEGVYGLHRNGDPAPWSELTEGGRYDTWLSCLETLRAALDGASSGGEGGK